MLLSLAAEISAFVSANVLRAKRFKHTNEDKHITAKISSALSSETSSLLDELYHHDLEL